MTGERALPGEAKRRFPALHQFARRHNINRGLLFVLPALTVYLLYVAWPVVSMLQDSLFEWDGISPTRTFVGLENYQRLLTADRAFQSAVMNNVQWAIIVIVACVSVGFVLAFILMQPIRFRNVYRTAFFLPTAASVVVIGFVWKFIYEDQIGPLNEGLRAIGQASLTRTWLVDPQFTLYAVIAVAIWATIGLFLIVCLAGIQSIPTDYFDSAAIDGANAFQQMIHIAIPLSSRTTRALIILGLIAAVNEFGFVFLLSQGGPFHASETIAYQVYDLAFGLNRTGYAAALSVVLVLISLVITIPQLRMLRSRRKAA